MNKRFQLLPLFLLVLSGCDQVNQRLGLPDPAKTEAEGKAVGSACRHSGRAIEDCYSIYNWLPKAAIFNGWKEMDTYMRENQLESIPPQLPPPEPPNKKKKKAENTSTSNTDAPQEKEPEKTEAASDAKEHKSNKH